MYIASLVLFLYNIEINYTGKSNKTEEKSSMAEEEFQEQSSVKTETEKEQSAVEKKKAKCKCRECCGTGNGKRSGYHRE